MARQLTNTELGQLIGVSPSMASRLRNGHRLPSAAVMDSISRNLSIPLEILMAAHRQGPEEFGRVIRSSLDHQPTPA